MESSDMKNMVVLKNLPSNMVEEAIIIFKENQRVRAGGSASPTEKTIEAEMLVTNYISKIENKDKSINLKYKRLKYYSFTISAFFIISLIINFIQ